MTTNDAFLQAICERPEDDSAWLIYADWLEEQGQGASAEFIRTQVSLTNGRRPLTADGRDHLERRARELMAEHADAWAKPLKDLGAIHVEFRRGLPYHITIPAEQFLENAARLFELAPLQSLKFTGLLSPDQCERLAALPQLARLTSLNLEKTWIEDDGARALAASPHLAGLTSLNLELNGIRAGGARALAASPNLAGLTVLNLESNFIKDGGARALADSPHLACLTSLNLWGNGIGPDGARALAESPRFGNTSLNLGNNQIGGETMLQIERAIAKRQGRQAQGRISRP